MSSQATFWGWVGCGGGADDFEHVDFAACCLCFSQRNADLHTTHTHTPTTHSPPATPARAPAVHTHTHAHLNSRGRELIKVLYGSSSNSFGSQSLGFPLVTSTGNQEATAVQKKTKRTFGDHLQVRIEASPNASGQTSIASLARLGRWLPRPLRNEAVSG